jgi:hypothetical protein
MASGGDRASGLSTLAHTNISAVYVPGEVGIQDCEGLRDCPASSVPVIQDKE